MTDLKPCPFCGGQAIIADPSWRSSDGSETAWIECKSCGGSGPAETRMNAIAAWNRRATLPEVTALVEAGHNVLAHMPDHPDNVWQEFSDALAAGEAANG